MHQIIFALPRNETFANNIAIGIEAAVGKLIIRHFPDGESLIRVESNVAGMEAIVVCTLDRPDEKVIPLLFVCDSVRALGAARITLVAPYLAYMRQDVAFHPGEAIAAQLFANILSPHVDRLITVDPHLHRMHTLQEKYPMPSATLRAATRIAEWIVKEVPSPLLIGPDVESAQRVREVAALANAPFVVLSKTRHGDRDVEVSIPHIEEYLDRTPVLVDDIIATGRTMIQTLKQLRAIGAKPAICIAVHAVFAEQAYEDIVAAGAARIVTCDTITHPSNGISIVGDIVEQLRLGADSVE